MKIGARVDLWYPTLRTEHRRAKDGVPTIRSVFKVHDSSDLGCAILAKIGVPGKRSLLEWEGKGGIPHSR